MKEPTEGSMPTEIGASIHFNVDPRIGRKISLVLALKPPQSLFGTLTAAVNKGRQAITNNAAVLHAPLAPFINATKKIIGSEATTQIAQELIERKLDEFEQSVKEKLDSLKEQLVGNKKEEVAIDMASLKSAPSEMLIHNGELHEGSTLEFKILAVGSSSVRYSAHSEFWTVVPSGGTLKNRDIVHMKGTLLRMPPKNLKTSVRINWQEEGADKHGMITWPIELNL